MKITTKWFVLWLIVIVLNGHLAMANPGIRFIENKGQLPMGAFFGADIPGGNFYIHANGFSYLFHDTRALHNLHEGISETNCSDNMHEDGSENEMLGLHLINVSFSGANDIEITPEEISNTNYNYFYGNDQSKWVSHARSYGVLTSENIYELIDLKLYASEAQLKYDLIVHEGAFPETINIKYDGADLIYIDRSNLIVKTSVNEVTEYRPYAYQEIDGKRVEVACEYKLNKNVLSFDFPLGYNECYDLIIDPLLIFSTYSGSAADNWGNTATFGENGKLYAGGITNHTRNGSFLGSFPATAGAYQTSYGGVWDVAILKYDSAGTNVEYATYLGGSGSEVPHSLIMDENEDLIIYGTTNSVNFPTTADAYTNTFQGGSAINTILGITYNNGSDCFIAKLSKDGSILKGSTYFGGDRNDGLLSLNNTLVRNYGDQQRGEVFVDTNNNIYVIGNTRSENLFDDVTFNSFNRNYGGGDSDAFILSVNESLSQVRWGGYMGGTSSDSGLGIRVAGDSTVFVTGGTSSNDLPIPTSGLDDTNNGGVDGWVASIFQEGDSVLSGTYIGASRYDQSYFIDLDSDGAVYIYGQSNSDLPNTTGLSLGSGQFIQKLNPELDNLAFSMTFGGSNGSNPNISPTAFLVNDCNNLYVAGWGSDSPNFAPNFGNNYVPLTTRGLPTTSDAIERNTLGQDFYLMVLDTDATEFLYGTFFGGSDALVHVDGGTSRFDKSGVVYHSVCASCSNRNSSFPTSPGAWSATNNAIDGCNNAAFKFDLATLRAGVITNTISLDNPGVRQVCLGDAVVFQNLSIGGEIFEWDLGDGEMPVTTDTAFIQHNYSKAGVFRVSLKAIDRNTCVGEDIAFTTIEILNPAFFVSDDNTVCEGDGTRLVAVGGDRYEWFSEDNTFTSVQSSPLVEPTEDTKYYVRLYKGQCSKLDSVMIKVIPSIEFDFTLTKNHDCFSRPQVRFVNNTIDDMPEFSWDLGDGNTSNESDFVHNYENDGVYQVRLIGSKDGLCVFEEQQTIAVYTVKVPNIITPNVSEGKNDKFVIESGTPVNLKVLNRWGKIIFEMEDYDNRWDATGQSSGVYFYEAKILDEVVCRGWVQVVK